jgi:hypothetical protein
MKTSITLTKQNAAAIAKYAGFVGCTETEFLNKFLADFMIQQFEDPDAGALEGYLASFKFRDHPAAERLLAWLENRTREDSIRSGFPITLEARIEESAEGFFTIEATQSYNGQS